MATLTIADLDNGKRDLETVDAVANSQADTTPTRYGQQTLTLAGALRRLGWQAPAPYAPGLVVDRATMTVERDGVVYRPDPVLLPFTTGAWNPDQWRVVQNSRPGDELLVYPSRPVAATAANTLPDGQNVEITSDGSYSGKTTRAIVDNRSLVFLGYAADSKSVSHKADGGGAIWRTAAQKLNDVAARADYSTDANFAAAKAGKVSVDGAQRVRSPRGFIAGEKDAAPTGMLRDSFIVARDVVGATDCHAFADVTVIKDVTDYGGYGVFDATTKVEGGRAQDHLFAFQDRLNYSGSGSIKHLNGMISWPVHSGTGNLISRNAVNIADVSVTNGGSVGENIGVFINDLQHGVSKAAIFAGQSTGHVLYAPGGAPTYHKGNVSIGAVDSFSAGVPLSVKEAEGHGVAFIGTQPRAVNFGAVGDFSVQTISNGAVRVEVTNSGDSYTFRPGADNAQPLGDMSRRWSQVYAGTGSISTSDERKKTQFRETDAAEKQAALQIKSAIRGFRWVDSVDKKGNAARWHFGVGAQTVGRIMQDNGLDPALYAFWCREEKEGEESFGIRYADLAFFILSAV